MSRSRTKRRAAARKRHYVKRGERVKPSALAEAKKRPWPMRQLLERGDLSATQFEAGIEIVGGFDALTNILSLRGGSVTGRVLAQSVLAEISDAQARMAAIYIGYANELLARLKVRARWVAGFIVGNDPLKPSGLPLLVAALDLWHDHRDDWDPRLTSSSQRVLISRPRTDSKQGPSQQHHRRRANAAATSDAPPCRAP